MPFLPQGLAPKFAAGDKLPSLHARQGKQHGWCRKLHSVPDKLLYGCSAPNVLSVVQQRDIHQQYGGNELPNMCKWRKTCRESGNWMPKVRQGRISRRVGSAPELQSLSSRLAPRQPGATWMPKVRSREAPGYGGIANLQSLCSRQVPGVGR